MRAAFDDLSLVEYQYFIGVLNSGQAVGNHQDGLFLGQLLKGKLDLMFVLGMQDGVTHVSRNEFAMPLTTTSA